MAIVVAIIIAVAGTAISAISSNGYKDIRRWWTYRKARNFWRPLVSGDLKIALGRFTKLGELDITQWEATGLVGMGDVHAATLAESFLDDVGVRRLGQTFDIVDGDQIPEDLSNMNLICLGGPDVNRITRKILDRINNTIVPGNWKDNNISFHDTGTDQWFRPELDIDEDGRKIVTLDRGLIIRVPNPWNPSRTVLIVAGSFGYGTWAGVMLARSPEFLGKSLISQGHPIECLYETDVFRGTPLMPRINELKLIAH